MDFFGSEMFPKCDTMALGPLCRITGSLLLDLGEGGLFFAFSACWWCHPSQNHCSAHFSPGKTESSVTVQWCNPSKMKPRIPCRDQSLGAFSLVTFVLRHQKYWSTYTWKTGDILHMSMSPEPRYCPVERKKVRRGIPKQRDSSRNWTKLCLWWRGSVVEFASCDQNSIICAGDKLIVE